MSTYSSHAGRAVASVAMCALGALAMYLTGGETGIGWAVLALFLIWVDAV